MTSLSMIHFRTAFKHLLDDRGHGAQAEMADELVVSFTNNITNQFSSKSNFFQRNGTGASLISAIPLSIRSFNSSLEVTRMWRKKVRAIFEKAHSTRLSQEPCFGVWTYSNLPGRVARYFMVSFEMCAEWLSKTTRMIASAG